VLILTVDGTTRYQYEDLKDRLKKNRAEIDEEIVFSFTNFYALVARVSPCLLTKLLTDSVVDTVSRNARVEGLKDVSFEPPPAALVERDLDGNYSSETWPMQKRAPDPGPGRVSFQDKSPAENGVPERLSPWHLSWLSAIWAKKSLAGACESIIPS
jgi:hypothetical protein